jgi:hypothetical protein
MMDAETRAGDQEATPIANRSLATDVLATDVRVTLLLERVRPLRLTAKVYRESVTHY